MLKYNPNKNAKHHKVGPAFSATKLKPVDSFKVVAEWCVLYILYICMYIYIYIKREGDRETQTLAAVEKSFSFRKVLTE